MSDSIKLQVYTQASPTDTAKTAVTDATVALLKRVDADKLTFPFTGVKATHVHDAGGFYKPSSTTPLDPGQYLLVVQKEPALAPVIQRVTLAAKAGVLEIAAGWDKTHKVALQCATVSIVNVGQRATPSSEKAAFATLNVLLLARTEWVGLASHNHFSRRTPADGTRYLPFAEGRRNQLFKTGVTDKATICTILDCQGRRTLVTVKSAAPSHQAWVVLHEQEKSPLAADKDKKRPADTSDREIGIEDFYRAVDAIGKAHPGTLLEAGVFGHGWVQGPIVWGTSDFEPTAARWPGGGGTAKDLDGRQKDFMAPGQRTPGGAQAAPPVPASVPAFFTAFRKGGQLRLWGCVHMNNVLAQCSEANRQLDAKTPRDRFFTVAYPEGGKELGTLDDVKRNVAQGVVSSMFARTLEHGDSRGNVTFAGAAAQLAAARCDVFAAPMGMGSNYAMRSQDNVFIVVDGGENKAPYAWWRREFGSDFFADADGYANYSKLRVAKLPDPGWRTQRFAVLRDDSTEFSGQKKLTDCWVLRLPSGFELFASKSVGAKAFADPIAHTFNGASGHLYIVRGMIVDALVTMPLGRAALLQSSSDRDIAVFVDATGSTRLLEAGKGAKPADFALRTAAVAIHPASFKWRNEWDVAVSSGGLTTGVLHAVTPGWFW